MSGRVTLLAAAILGALALANGLLMVVNPEGWYWLVPGVPDRGPFNQHFVRDIGICYGLIGASFLAGIMRPAARVTLWLLPTLWLAGHALFHVWEVMVGICGPASLLEDFLGVTLPALIGAGLVLTALRDPFRPETTADA